ncbi:MAG: hypothetical protein FD145_423 [Candidatus Saganbacteria bacterium]|uniref:CBM11 domain-containing protein n=1 Tax=Candidatus Saganbacteria bacterium TaxID=2575572 RepID=A0A833P0B9_UNCSA|nr:MAG: hypothetical protein FD145_423 [Candidatus Saganbacteria bacterium]
MKLFLSVLTIIVLSVTGNAYMLDNFEDGLIKKDPAWFEFDGVKLEVCENALSVSGFAKNWYIGGIGTDLAKDLSRFKTFEMDVYGYGDASGKIKVELYDDDNGNDKIETDKKWKPTNDDLWTSEINIDWYGAKHVSIPFSEFKCEGKGNKIWDPNFENNSKGIIKLQLIFLSSTKVGDINCSIDNIQFN